MERDEPSWAKRRRDAAEPRRETDLKLRELPKVQKSNTLIVPATCTFVRTEAVDPNRVKPRTDIDVPHKQVL
jgi:hypothetical protein